MNLNSLFRCLNPQGNLKNIEFFWEKSGRVLEGVFREFSFFFLVVRRSIRLIGFDGKDEEASIFFSCQKRTRLAEGWM